MKARHSFLALVRRYICLSYFENVECATDLRRL